MKTPIQELIEQLKEERDGFLKLPPLCGIQERTENCFGSCVEIAERMLKKEKDVIIDAYNSGQESNWSDDMGLMGDWYYDETFNTILLDSTKWSNL